MTLFDPDDPNPDDDASALERAWLAFHTDHPDVAVALHRLAVRLLDRGYTHLGIGMLWETLRYNTMLGAGPDEDAYRLNNNHRAHYARYLMATYPRLAGVFELRELHS